jgi:hypothetical protein
MITIVQFVSSYLNKVFREATMPIFWWQLTAVQKLQRFKHLSWLALGLIGLLFWRLEFWLALGLSLLIVLDWTTTWQLLSLRANLTR